MEIQFKSNLPEVAAAWDKAPQLMDQKLEQYLSRAAEEIARAARDAAPKAKLTLANSIKASKIANLHYRVSPSVNYAVYVEEGTRPHRPGSMPDSRRLLPWVKLKLRLQGKEANRAAFAIARAIGKRGTRPQPYMRPTYENTQSQVIQLLEQRLLAAASQILSGST